MKDREMCLILIKPNNCKNHLDYERFCKALKHNPHSVGILYKKGDKLKVKKYINPKSIKKKIFNMIKNKNEYAIHFRYATHGNIDTKNCHPFRVVDGLYLMHNGIMSAYGDMNKKQSDTRNFIDYYLRPLIEKNGVEIIYTKEFKEMVEKEIGTSNKIVLIDKDFNVIICNESAGSWIDGNWLSNTYSTEEYYYKSYSKPLSNYVSKYKSLPIEDIDNLDYYDDYWDYMEDNYNYFDRMYYDEETIKFLKDKQLEKILSEPYGYYDYDKEKYCY